MGLADSLANRQRTRQQALVVGPWLADQRARLPMLRREDLLTVAAIDAVLSTDTRKGGSPWAAPGETEAAEDSSGQRSVHPMLQVQQVNRLGHLVTCAAPSPWGYTEDWTLGCVTEDGPDRVVVLANRTLHDGELPNHEVLAALRRQLARALRDGPGPISLTSGPPSPAKVVQRQPTPSKQFPLADETLSPVPAGFQDGAAVAFPAAGLEPVRALIDSGVIGGDLGRHLSDHRVIGLDGGRPEHGAHLMLIPFGPTGQPELRLKLIEESPSGQQRTFHAAMTELRALARAVATNAASTAAVIDDYVNELIGLAQRSCTQVDGARLWDTTTSGPIVDCGPGATIPLGIVLSGTTDSVHADIRRAQSYLLSVVRKPPGVSVLPSGRLFRGPMGWQDQQQNLHLHYGQTSDWFLDDFAPLDLDNGWFWGTALRTAHHDDGRQRAILMVTGLSRIDSVLCYGPELLRLFASFAALVKRRQPEVIIETISLNPAR